MSHDLAPTAKPTLPVARGRGLAQRDVVAAWLDGRNPRTVAAYERDVDDFANFLASAAGTAAVDLVLDQTREGPEYRGALASCYAAFRDRPTARPAVELLLNLAHGDANGLANDYRADLTKRGLQTATIARRLAALRSVVKLARLRGWVAWALDVESPRVEPYRDTAGPGEAGWRSMLSVAKLGAESSRAKAVRDLALVRLLHDLALRRSEVVALDVASIDLDAGTVEVIGKGKTQALRMTLPDPTRDALAAWLDVRGWEPGPLFVRLDRARAAVGPSERLTDTAVYQIVRALGTKAGLSRPTRPHALRHQAITRALDETGGDVRTVQRYSRHADTRTLLLYDDRRNDAAGEVAKLVAAD